MKNRVRIILVTVLCLGLVFLSGCGGNDEGQKEASNENSKLQEQRELIAGEGSYVGIAFLGYVEEVSTQEDLENFVKEISSDYSEYSFLTECPVIEHEGQELYAIVAADEDYSLKVFESEVSEDGKYKDDMDDVLYDGKLGNSIILKCNQSEIYSNVLVSVDIPDRESYQFRPQVSLKDGRVVLEDGCYDFTEYDKEIGIGYMFDMAGDWWSKPLKGEDGSTVYYRLMLEKPERGINGFELSTGNEVFDTWFGDFETDEDDSDSKNSYEYEFTMFAQDEERSGDFKIERNSKDENCITVSEEGGDELFFLTGDKSVDFTFHPYPDLSDYGEEEMMGFEDLRLKDDVLYNESHNNMDVICTGERQKIYGSECMIFARGTNKGGNFVREIYYGVSTDGKIFTREGEEGEWMPLGDG